MTRSDFAALVFAGTLVGAAAPVSAQTTPTSPSENPTQDLSTEGAKPKLNAPQKPAEPPAPVSPDTARGERESKAAEQSKPPTGAPASPRTSPGTPMDPDDRRALEEKKKGEQSKPQ